MEVPEDLDDYSGLEPDVNAECSTPSVTSAILTSSLLEKAWNVESGRMDWGPNIPDKIIQEETEVKVDFTHLSRPLGFTTSAWIKTARILEASGHLTGWKHCKLNICCLADGDGGDSRWLADHYVNSVVIWNSLNPDVVGHVANPLGLRILDEESGSFKMHPRIRCRTQTLEGGDLTKPHIVQLIKDEAPVYHIVKHDASLPVGEERSRVAKVIWGACLDVWVEKGEPASIMIQKVFTDIPETLAWLLGKARDCSKVCHLVTLRESHCSHEAYLFCQYPVHFWANILPEWSAPLHLRKLAFQAADFNQTILSDCIEGLSSREVNLGLPVQLPDTPLPPLKAMTTLPEIGLDERFATDPDMTLGRVTTICVQLLGQLEGLDVEFEDENQPDDTFTHLVHVTGRYLFWESVRIILMHFKNALTFLRVRATGPAKRVIVGMANTALLEVTKSRRWRRMGGPFEVFAGETTPLEIEGRATPPVAPLPFRSNFQAGIKLGMGADHSGRMLAQKWTGY